MKRSEYYNHIDEVLNIATKNFSPIYEENIDKCKKFFECYDLFVDICNEYDGISFEMNVDEYTQKINLILECGYFEVPEKVSAFSKLISKANNVEFTCSNDDTTLINFEFDGIWDKKEQFRRHIYESENKK